MNLADFHPVKNAERVCIHKCALTIAWTISFGVGRSENAAPYFSRNDVIMLSKYNRHAAHHALFRRIVLLSQYTAAVSPAMIFSQVSAQRLL